MATIRSPDGRHGVIVLYAFGGFREADFLDDPELIDRLVAGGEGWRFADAVRLDDPEDPVLSRARTPAGPA